MKPLALLVAAFALCAGIGRDAVAAGRASSESARQCAAGSVRAAIAGRTVCLRVGQRCAPRLDLEYRRYGFRCPFHGRLERIPPEAGTVIATIPDADGYVAVGEGAVWVRGMFAAEVLRVDPARNVVVDRIQLPRPRSAEPFSLLSGIAAGGGGVWVAVAARDEIVRIDPATDVVVAAIPVGEAPAGVAVANGSVWVANRFGNSVSRIDVATNVVVATINFGDAAGEGPISVAAGAGAVWVDVPGVGGVVRIDPATNAIEAVIPLSLGRTMAKMNGIAADARSVWVAGTDLVRIDPVSNRVVATIAGPTLPVGVAIGLGSVWTTSWTSWAASGLVSRIDPLTNRSVGESHATSVLPAVAVGFGSVWVAGASERIRPR